MIEDSNKVWEEIFVVNDPTFELSYIGDNIPIITVKNILKYPDRVKEFLSNGYWWINGINSDNYRAGKSFYFGENEEVCLSPLVEYFQQLFGLKYIEVLSLYANCLNGNMNLQKIDSAFPHVDVWPNEDDYELYLDGNSDLLKLSTEIAFNINLTEWNENPVKTAFWSFKNKKSIFEFTREDFNDYESFNEQLDNNVNKWFQLDNNYGQYKLEDIVTIEYNSMILYPSFYWHSPYLKSDWFTNADRITLTGFFAIDPNNMSFSKEEFKNIYNVWRLFGLNEIYGLNQ